MTSEKAPQESGHRAIVISPQDWDGFKVSKHHYAKTLVDMGWEVVFVDPPKNLGRPGHIEMTETEFPGLSNLKYQVSFPYRLKFHLRPLFNFLMKLQARRISKIIGKVDLVWDFDNAYQFSDLRAFGAPETIFHLVDDVSVHGLGTKSANHVFFLHPPYCQHAGGEAPASHHIDVGLGTAHAEIARKGLEQSQAERPDSPPHIGYAGNLAEPKIDWKNLLEIVRRHPEAKFTFWGPQGDTAARNADFAALLELPNAHFPGLVTPQDLAAQSQSVDIWLVPFVFENVLGGSVNSHKIMEYLATGRVIVMTWLSAYDGNDLVQMLPGKDNADFPDVFDEVIGNLDTYNAPDLMQRRRQYALDRTYEKHVSRIFETAGIDAS